VLATVELDHQLILLAAKISDVRTDLMLSPDFVASESAVTQVSPQATLRIGHFTSQATRRFT